MYFHYLVFSVYQLNTEQWCLQAWSLFSSYIWSQRLLRLKCLLKDHKLYLLLLLKFFVVIVHKISLLLFPKCLFILWIVLRHVPFGKGHLRLPELKTELVHTPWCSLQRKFNLKVPGDLYTGFLPFISNKSVVPTCSELMHFLMTLVAYLRVFFWICACKNIKIIWWLIITKSVRWLSR